MIDIVATDINKRLKPNKLLKSDENKSVTSACQNRFARAKGRCKTNFAIGVAGLAISGFFSLGIGTIVGAGFVSGLGVKCTSDALSDYNDCVNQTLLYVPPMTINDTIKAPEYEPNQDSILTINELP